jgi:hypothetical protein
VKQGLVSSTTLSRPGKGGKSSGLGMARGPRLVQRLSGPRAKGMLGPAEGPSDLQWLSGSGVGAEQGQIEPWPRDRRSAGIVAPAQLEQIVSVLDHDGFPPRRPSALRFGQHEMTERKVRVVYQTVKPARRCGPRELILR